MATESLKNKTIKGTAWSAADAFLGQCVTFIVGIILARLLSPDDYGLIGIIAIFTSICTMVIGEVFNADYYQERRKGVLKLVRINKN